MGIRSYVEGMKADSVQNATNLGWSALGIAADMHNQKKALDQAKEKTDITREYKGAQTAVDEFLNDLQYDRDYQNYNQRVEEKFSEIASTIQDNQLLSDGARRELMESFLPQLKQETLGKTSILSTNAQMAEIEVEIEGFGDTVASDPNKGFSDAVSDYRSHIEDLGIFNDYTVGKMVEEFSYSTAPLKALQTLQSEYQEYYLDDSYSLDSRVKEIGSEMELDAPQERALRKSVTEFQTNYDKNIDMQFAQQKDILLGEIAGARDAGELFDIESIDALIEQVPARHKLELYKTKNTALANNDDVLYQGLNKVINEGRVLTQDEWQLVDMFHDPKKRDKVSEEILVNQGNALLSSGKSLAQARMAIDQQEGPISLKNRTEAKARLTKAYLEQESEVSKVAQDLLGSVGHTPMFSQIPQGDYDQMVKAGTREAPPIDVDELQVRGETYVDEQERLVTSFLSKSPSFKLPNAPLTFDPAINTEPIGNPSDEESVESDPIIQEIAQEIVARQIEEAIPEGGVDDESTGIPSSPTGSSWLGAYEEKVAQRRKEVAQERLAYQEELDRQAEYVQRQAGAPKDETPQAVRTKLHGGMSQVELVTTALQSIKDGEGRYIATEELALIKDDSLRQELTTLSGIRDSFSIDSPLALDFIDQLRRDPTVSDSQLGTAIRDFVERGFMKAETGDRLTKKYSFAQTDRRDVLTRDIDEAVSAVFPRGAGEYLGNERSRLKERVSEAVDAAIAMNPDLLGKDFAQLQQQIGIFVTGEASREVLGNLEKVSKLMSEGNISRRIDNLEHSDVSTFLQDVEEGRYDLLINYDFVQQPEMRSSRHDSREVLLDKVAQGMSPYRDFSDLSENGTMFERFRVIANTNFILAGGTLEKALTGSFGIKPSDMKIVGKQWAFTDPEADGLYFIATDTDVEKRGTLGWGMATTDYDGTKGFIMFRDYVDPQLAYDIENLQAQMSDPLFERKKVAADQNRSQSPLGTGGLGYSPVRVQESLDDRYYGIIEAHETKTKELQVLMHDIMTYRHNLLGTRSGSLPKRL
ncbi:hypothetical protein [Pleomorphochaeta sp. DL1XJH-081]|uniref:hypothetical protein n=1 Tax=Pleomorphochaeta sp. DL1XJH-081 TaxID=3409690 RepID=UPI003BB5482C